MNKVDLSKLTRDYKEQPLRKYVEKAPKEDVEYLYLECNCTYAEGAKILGISESVFSKWCVLYKLKKPYSLRVENQEKTCLKKYGCKSSLSNKDIRAKGEETMLEKYGVSNAGKSKEIREKIEQTNLERLGVRHPSQSPKVQETLVKNNREKYGVDYVSQRPNHYKNRNNKKHGNN